MPDSAAKLLENGHELAIGTRDPKATLAKTEPDGYGNPPFAQWLQAHSGAKLLPFAEAAAQGQVILNATNGAASISALSSADAANLRGKIILDIANPWISPRACRHHSSSRTPTPSPNKSAAAYLQAWFGWKPESIIDLGDITTARGTEMLLPIWIRLWGALGSPMFNFKIVR